MDFTFSDINGTLMSMSQGKLPNLQGSDSSRTDLKSGQFMKKLNRLFQEHQPQAVSDNGEGTSQEGGLPEMLAESMGQEEGIAFLNQLRALFLTLSNGNPENLSINGQGLDSLGQLLVKAGFDPASVDELMAGFSLSLEEGEEVTISDLMGGLFELPLEEEETEAYPETENLMATSDVPYMYALLGALGLEEGKISEIMSQASRGGQGFSLDTAVEMLRQFEADAFSSGMTYQTAEDDDSYLTFLKQLGLDAETSGKGTLTLSGLINSLEQKQEALASVVPGNETTQTTGLAGDMRSQSGTSQSELFGQLLKGLDTSASATAQAAADADLVTGQIREQLKNDALDPVRSITVDDANGGKQTPDKVNPAFLAGQANADGGGKTGSGMKEPSAETISLLGKSKDKPASYTDAGQAAQAGEKTTGTNVLASGAMAKAKQTFSSLPNHVTQQVGKNIVRAVNLGENTLRLQLKPAELGRVFMTIDNTGDSMKVSIITENQSAKEILASNVNEIRSILSSSGISLEKFEVDMSSNFRQSMADARGQGQSNKKKSGKGLRSMNDVQDEKSNNLSTLAAAKEYGGSLHFVA